MKTILTTDGNVTHRPYVGTIEGEVTVVHLTTGGDEVVVQDLQNGLFLTLQGLPRAIARELVGQLGLRVSIDIQGSDDIPELP